MNEKVNVFVLFMFYLCLVYVLYFVVGNLAYGPNNDSTNLVEKRWFRNPLNL